MMKTKANEGIEPRSPYSVFEGEECALMEIENEISVQELSYLMRNNFIGRLEQCIIQLINRFFLLNTKQIQDLLCIWFSGAGRDAIENSLSKLCNKAFLRRIVMKRRDNPILRYTYVIGTNACAAVANAREFPNPQNIVPYEAKKLLAANQLVISALKEFPNIPFALHGIKLLNGNAVHYDALMNINSTTYYAFVERNGINGEAYLHDDIDCMRMLSEHDEHCRILVVCESAEHASYVAQYIRNIKRVTVIYDRELHYYGFTQCVCH